MKKYKHINIENIDFLVGFMMMLTEYTHHHHTNNSGVCRLVVGTAQSANLHKKNN